jgi:putative isomerase
MKETNSIDPLYRAPVPRRSVLRGLAASGLVSALPCAALASSALDLQSRAGSMNTGAMNSEELSQTLHQLLVSDSKELYQFAIKVYSTCILGKIRPADPPLNHAWIVPGGGYYAQWLWDTMFVVDLLSLLPGQKEVIRGAFQNYWDFQLRWNAVKPGFMHGMIANFMAPFDAHGFRDGRQWQTVPAYSQAPLLAWGMERVFDRNGDRELLRTGLGPLESFHDWYWRERDVANLGLIGVGAYSGDPQYARYETYDREVDLDDLKMIAHPMRLVGIDNGPWYGDIAIPANTAYLLRSELALARMAKIMGDQAMAERRMARYEHGAAAMRKHMWDEKSACYLAVHIQTQEKIATATVGGFMPLMAHVPTESHAASMAAALQTPAWATPLPIPTVARTDRRYSSGEFWRGDVWPAPNYQVASGFAAYGHRDAAERIADASVANALKVGISERYDSLSGVALGVKGLGMSASVLTMILDGLTSGAYSMRVRGHGKEGT